VLDARAHIRAQVLAKSFETYNGIAAAKNDPWGKKFFPAVHAQSAARIAGSSLIAALCAVFVCVRDVPQMPFTISDSFYVAMITPVIHYCMGGVDANAHSEVVGDAGIVK
jgi:hypothetical protein